MKSSQSLRGDSSGLASATVDELADIRVVSFGTSIHWPSLDVQFTTIAILEEMFGVKTVHSAVAKGGSARTEAKSAAARANGALGGRPRKDAKKVKASPKTA